MHTEEIQLKHTLADSELAKLAKDQANAIERKKGLELEVISIKKDYAGRVAIADSEIAMFSARVNAGWEMRNVRCIIADHRPEDYRLVIRTDNGHIAIRRKLEPEERQMKLSTDAPRQYAAAAILTVDDENWDVDAAQVPLYDDEIEILGKIRPAIQFLPLNKPGTLQLGAGEPASATTSSKKKRKKAGK